MALFEAHAFPRHKVCGEFVSAESLQVLEQMLGHSGRERVIHAAPQLDRTRLFLGDRILTAKISPPARSITRYDLDEALWFSAQAAGVITIAECEVGGTQGDGPFEVQLPAGTCRVNAVVIAAGRWSRFTSERTLRSGPKWVGLKAHFAENHLSAPSTDLYFFAHGYCGVQLIGAGVVNACAMVRSDQATALPDVFRLHPKLAERAADWRPVTAPVTTAPLVHRPAQPVSRNMLFVGDAAAFIDPFVGDGISIALRSGEVAARCLAPLLRRQTALADCVAEYDREYRSHFMPLLAAAARVRALLSLPRAARAVAFELLRIPGVMPLVIRRTRQTS